MIIDFLNLIELRVINEDIDSLEGRNSMIINPSYCFTVCIAEFNDVFQLILTHDCHLFTFISLQMLIVFWKYQSHFGFKLSISSYIKLNLSN